MKSTYNGGDSDQTEHSLSPSEAFSTSNGLYLIELLAKGIHQELSNNPGCGLNYILLSTNWQQDLHILFWHLWYRRCSAQYQSRNANTNPATNTLISNAALPARYVSKMVAQHLWKSPSNTWFDLRPTPSGETHTFHYLSDQEPETN